MKKILISTILIMSFALVVLLSACDDSINARDIDNQIIPEQNVSYSEHIQPVFNVKCNNSGCHNSSDMAGGLSLITWANTVSDPSVVFPKEPEVSKLYWAITGNGAPIMPPLGYQPLTQNQIDGIKTWIQEGAKNN